MGNCAAKAKYKQTKRKLIKELMVIKEKIDPELEFPVSDSSGLESGEFDEHDIGMP